jgi:dienelactone hydrolase
MVRIILSLLIFASTSCFGQSWQNIQYGDRPIPIKFVKSSNEGKSPTIMLVHGTAGPDERENSWAKFLSNHGYNTVIVDFKTGRFSGPHDRHRPFYPSLIEKVKNWIEEQPTVDRKNIIYMGFSLGGFLGFRLDSTTEFSKYILFYPGCWNLLKPGLSYMVEKERINPTLVVWGNADSYEEGQYCPKVVDKMKGEFSWIAIDKAGHGFDGNRFASFSDQNSPSGRASIEPSQSALVIARQKVLEFLQSYK